MNFLAQSVACYQGLWFAEIKRDPASEPSANLRGWEKKNSPPLPFEEKRRKETERLIGHSDFCLSFILLNCWFFRTIIFKWILIKKFFYGSDRADLCSKFTIILCKIIPLCYCLMSVCCEIFIIVYFSIPFISIIFLKLSPCQLCSLAFNTQWNIRYES